MQGTSRLERFPSSIFLLLYTIIASNGASAQTCPNAPLVIICNITTPGPVTRWVVPPGYCPSNDIILSQPPGTDCGSKNDSCGPFVATNLVPPPGMACTTSVLSVVAAPQLNGTNISCYSNGNLQYQHVILIATPPGLPLVTVRPMGSGLVVSCTPGTNGDPPTSYDITVEPNGTHITAFNGMVEQNIPGLIPNTTYTVRVIAINCAGSSGVVATNATTANDTAQPDPRPSQSTAHNAVGIAVGVGVGVGVLLIMVITAIVIMMLYKRCHHKSHQYHEHDLLPKPTLLLSKLPEGMFPELVQTFIIVWNEASSPGQVFEVENFEFVKLKQRKISPSDDQIWYKKYQSDGSFIIVSKHIKKAIKHDPVSSQVILCSVTDGDHWMMDDISNNIVCMTASKPLYIYLGDHDALFCGDEENKEVKKQKKTFSILEVKPDASKVDPFYCIKDINNDLVVTASKSESPLICSSDKLRQELYWYKKFPKDTNNEWFLIATSSNDVISCSTEGERRSRDDYLWKEEDEYIVSVRHRLVIGVQDSEMGALHTCILCEKLQSKYKLKMVSLPPRVSLKETYM